MTEIMFGPYEPDVASVGTPKTSFVNNVFPRSDGYGPIPAVVAFTQALTGTCRGVTGAVQSDNSSAVFAGNDTRLFKLDATTRAWDDVSRAALYNVSAKELWDFAQFGNDVIATTSNNNVQRYTLGTSALFADLAGSPPQARRCFVVGDFLVLAGLTNNPNRVQWSDINNITVWTPGTGLSDFQDFPDGGFVQGGSGGEYGLIFQDRAIRRMIFSGHPDIFQFQRISDDRGVLMRYSICKSGGTTFFLSNDGYYKIDRGGGMVPIGSSRVNRTVLADADLTDPRFMIGLSDPLSQRVIWFYKSIGNGNSNLLDKAIIYDWAFDKWSKAEFSAINATGIIPLGVTLESLDAVGNLDALPFSLDSYTSTFSSAPAVMLSNGTLGFMNGSAMEATLDTPEGSIGNGELTLIRGAAPIGDASAAQVSMKYRDRLIDPILATTETVIGTRGYAEQRVTARFNTARVRIPSGSTWTFARGVDVDARKAGGR